MQEQEPQGRLTPDASKTKWTVSAGDFSVGLCFQTKNVSFSAAILAAGIVFLCFVPNLVWESQPTGHLPVFGKNLALYLSVILLSTALCLVRIQIPRWVRKPLSWAVLLWLPIPAFYGLDWINGTWYDDFSFPCTVGNYLCCLLVLALFYAVFRRVWATALAGGGVLLLFGIANYFTVQFRGSPILPWDLQSMGTAAAVLGNYVLSVTPEMAVCLFAWLLLIVVTHRLFPVEQGESKRARLLERGASLLASVTLLFLLLPGNLLSNLDVTVWAWDQKTSMKMTGVTAGFVANLQFMLVEMPEGYSEESLEELKAEIDALPEQPALGRPGEAPTIIAVMNESLADLEKSGQGSIVLEPDNLSYLHSLQESGQVIWGSAYSSVFGGNTCNSEYEFLTGNTTAFLPVGSKPFQQYVNRQQTSLVSVLQEQAGYHSIAIHPGRASAWNRDKAYPLFGFDRFISYDEFTVPQRLVHGMTEDASGYAQVIEEYENRGDDPLFLFHVTIQNHGGYDDPDYPTTVRVAQAAGEFAEAEQYLSLVKQSDDALQDLIGYFEQQKEPVVILLFGDHWPSLDEAFFQRLLGSGEENRTLADTMRQHEVPFMIWANYPLEAQQIEKISLNYLSGLLLRSAGLQTSPYFSYLENLRETLPVITAVGMFDNKGTLYQNGEETPYDALLEKYGMLLYNQSFDTKGKQEELFSPAK